MKLAFDAKRLFQNNTGLGNYSRNLVNGLDQYSNIDYCLLANNTHQSSYKQFNNANIVDPKIRCSSIWRSFGIYREINANEADIYHGLSNEIPFSRKKIRAKCIVTIHDLFYIHYPNDFNLIDRNIYKLKTEFACKNADHIIAISDATKSDIVNYLNIKPEKISVIYQSCNPVFQYNGTSSSTLNLPREFFLFVGSLNKRKNILGILNAMGMIPPSHRIPLVVIGKGKKEFEKEIMERCSELQLENYVQFKGSVPNNELKEYYKRALFTCLPSFYEGFGIPVIESLFSGTPVIGSKVSALPEAVGECGILVKPKNSEQLASAIYEMTNHHYRYEKQIPMHLKKFELKETTKKLISCYESIL